jgi:hypothetical protein
MEIYRISSTMADWWILWVPHEQSRPEACARNFFLCFFGWLCLHMPYVVFEGHLTHGRGCGVAKFVHLRVRTHQVCSVENVIFNTCGECSLFTHNRILRVREKRGKVRRRSDKTLKVLVEGQADK